MSVSINYVNYVGMSLLAIVVVTWHAFATREQFFPAMMFLSTSKVAVAVGLNMGFAIALCVQRLVVTLFLGTLRDLEVEMIKEKLSSAVMESLLALTIFREEFGAFFVTMFGLLIFVKVLHWLVQDRVELLEVTPTISLVQHFRLVSFFLTLGLLDLTLLQYTVQGTIQANGQSVMLLFAFEYIILSSNVVRYFLKYLFSMIDLKLEGRWEAKSTFTFYLELVTDLLHLFVYCAFFALVFSNYGMPIHLIRELYMTFRNFQKRVVDFLRFRQITARLDRFSDASPEDLVRCDGVCIICREEMSATSTNKKLPCTHVFHVHCLRSWLEQQQNCPTCRASVLPPPATPPPRPPPQPRPPPPPAPQQQPGDGGGLGANVARARELLQGPREARALPHNFAQLQARVQAIHAAAVNGHAARHVPPSSAGGDGSGPRASTSSLNPPGSIPASSSSPPPVPAPMMFAPPPGGLFMPGVPVEHQVAAMVASAAASAVMSDPLILARMVPQAPQWMPPVVNPRDTAEVEVSIESYREALGAMARTKLQLEGQLNYLFRKLSEQADRLARLIEEEQIPPNPLPTNSPAAVAANVDPVADNQDLVPGGISNFPSPPPSLAVPTSPTARRDEDPGAAEVRKRRLEALAKAAANKGESSS